MAGLSPTQRTLRALRDDGRVCAIVEKFNPYSGPHGIRQDLFGIIDIISLGPGKRIVGIQSCGQGFSAHEAALLDEKSEMAREWLMAGGELELWGWRKLKLKRGGKAERWRPRVRAFSLEDFE